MPGFHRQTNALVGVIMGSKSDWETMQHTSNMLEALGIRS